MDKRITGRMLLAMDIDGTSVGRDHRLGEKTRQALRRFRQAGHVVCFAREVADRVVFMADGKILEEGTPAELFDRPKDPRLQDFLSKVL